MSYGALVDFQSFGGCFTPIKVLGVVQAFEAELIAQGWVAGHAGQFGLPRLQILGIQFDRGVPHDFAQ